VARAIAKDRLLESLGLRNSCLESTELTENQLQRWYFEELLHRPVPSDPNSYARSLGFAGPDAFRRALLKEYLYRRFEDQSKQVSEPTS
jgi:hypothetical protein